MITIQDLINTSANTVKIDWIKVEETIGFPLHYDLKNFYSRILCEEQKVISGNFNLVEDKFIRCLTMCWEYHWAMTRLIIL